MVYSCEQMGILTAFLVFAIVQIQCYGSSDPDPTLSKHYHPKHAPLMCYDCNSEYDLRCRDPFDNLSMPIVNCNEVKIEQHIAEFFGTPDVQPKVCRKLVQRIENYTRIIRGCGFLPDKYDDKRCPKRTGLKNVDVYYCACTKSLCNFGFRKDSNTVINVLLVFTVVSSVYFISV